MSRAKLLRRAGIAAAAATLSTLVFTGTANAYPVDELCRAATSAPVFSQGTGKWMYSIPAEHDMRVDNISPIADPNGRDIFFGHGKDQAAGYSYSNYFGSCRPG